ncbi:MAG: hypothetical protein ACKOVH_07290 [Actinomycetota bacterium]|nr:hypothetical protein [Actinomycetota bacterium]
MPDPSSGPSFDPSSSAGEPTGAPWGDELPLTTVESFVAALIEAGPEVAEHMVRAANELLLAAQAITAAAERRLAEQRRQREQAEAAAAGGPGPDAHGAPTAASDSGPVLRSVDEVA